MIYRLIDKLIFIQEDLHDSWKHKMRYKVALFYMCKTKTDIFKYVQSNSGKKSTVHSPFDTS